MIARQFCDVPENFTIVLPIGPLLRSPMGPTTGPRSRTGFDDGLGRCPRPDDSDDARCQETTKRGGLRELCAATASIHEGIGRAQACQLPLCARTCAATPVDPEVIRAERLFAIRFRRGSEAGRQGRRQGSRYWGSQEATDNSKLTRPDPPWSCHGRCLQDFLLDPKERRIARHLARQGRKR